MMTSLLRDEMTRNLTQCCRQGSEQLHQYRGTDVDKYRPNTTGQYVACTDPLMLAVGPN
jgi:hypothetical protein